MSKLTNEQLQDLKKQLKEKHGVVYELNVPLNDDGTESATIFLRKIDRVCFNTVSKLVQKDELMGIESLVKTLYIGGDDVNLIVNDFEALRAASIAVLPMLQAREASLKKN